MGLLSCINHHHRKNEKDKKDKKTDNEKSWHKTLCDAESGELFVVQWIGGLKAQKDALEAAGLVPGAGGRVCAVTGADVIVLTEKIRTGISQELARLVKIQTAES